MADKFDSGHVVLPVAHPTGEVHDIAFPADTPLAEVHNVLSDYHQPEPTKEGSMEHSAQFKSDAAKAWGSAASGLLKREAAYSIGRDGKAGIMTTHDTPAGETPNVTMQISPSTMATLHTHPTDSRWSDKPSGNDIEVAKQSHRVVYVVSQSGLWSVDPAGKVEQVFKSPTWMSDKNPK